MGVKFVVLKCPQCGGELEVKDGLDTYFCGYCGSKIILDEQSDAAYKAKTKAKKYEHEEIMRDKEYEQEKYKIQEKKEQEKRDMKILLFIIGALFMMSFFLLGRSRSSSDKEEKKLENLVEEIQMDIKSEDFDQAYIKAQKIKYTSGYSNEIEDKWDNTRKEVINQIIEAEKKATGKSTHEKETEKKGVLDKIFH